MVGSFVALFDFIYYNCLCLLFGLLGLGLVVLCLVGLGFGGCGWTLVVGLGFGVGGWWVWWLGV